MRQGFRLLLVNPVQVKALAGRKSDGRDADALPSICRMEDWMGASCPPPKSDSYG